MKSSIARCVARAGFAVWMGCFAGPTALAGTFTNPINRGPDPWMQFVDGNYYLTTTQGDCIRMWKAPSLAGLKTAQPVLVWRDSDPTRSHGIWETTFPPRS